MKKTIALLLVLVMAFSLAACSTETNKDADPTPDPTGVVTDPTDPVDTPEPVTTYHVGVSIYKFDDNFMTLYREELKNYFASLETDTVKYKVEIVDANNDMATQTEQVQTFIAQQVDVLIVNLVMTSSAETITELVADAGIPMVLINREPEAENILDNMCYVGAHAEQSGTYQGEIVLDLENKGDINGDGVIKYIMIMGDVENTDAQLRTEYSIKALTDAGVAVECLFEQTGGWDQAQGQELVASALAQYGKDIEVVFCNNDAMAVGAYQAIVAAGRVVGEDIYLLGVDALDECVEMVAGGTMTGTVLNDHVGQSHAAVDAAIKYLKGEAVDQYYWIDYQKITPEAAAEIVAGWAE